MLCVIRIAAYFPQILLEGDSTSGSVFLSEEGRLILDQLREDCDHEGTFLRETVKEDKNYGVESQSLYQSYRKWCQDNGYSPVGANKFKSAVLRVFPDVTYERAVNKCGQKETVIHGIAKS